MVNSLRVAGLDRGEWILTAYFVVVAASGVLPLALVAVELLPQSGGAAALATAAADVGDGRSRCVARVLAGPPNP